ncbi:hypothetical protein HDU99_006548 [Rhizoclosmatium hyalinum]|nr:hypothetical protein HDU99_006548 [Rhizoclosmatium hyalinum]
MNDLFWDEVSGGYFTGGKEDDGVLLRLKDEYDGAEPTPSSIAVKNLLRLEAILGSTSGAQYREKAEKTFLANMNLLQKSPRSIPQMVTGWIAYSRGYTEIVVQGKLSPDMQHTLDTTFNPLATVVQVPTNDSWLLEQNELLKSISESDSEGEGRVFLCEDGSCNAPVTSLDGLKAIL